MGKKIAKTDGCYLVADIGGTNTRIALTQGGHVQRDTIQRYANAAFLDKGEDAFDHILRAYIETRGGIDISACCVAIAGPMIGHTIDVTNLGWQVNATTVGAIVGARRVAFLNDLEALGHSLDELPENGTRAIFAQGRDGDDDDGGGGADAGDTRLVVGIGTGFNSAVVYRVGDHISVAASESGHMAFGARNAKDLRLSQFAAGNEGFCAVENVLSGRGLETVYAWAASEAGIEKTLTAAEIGAALERGDDPVAYAALEQFCRVLGGVLSDVTLTCLPFGGIYLAGGVARHLAPYFSRFGLQGAFVDKGRKKELMGSFEVRLIEDDYAALHGCARFLGESSK